MVGLRTSIVDKSAVIDHCRLSRVEIKTVSTAKNKKVEKENIRADLENFQQGR